MDIVYGYMIRLQWLHYMLPGTSHRMTGWTTAHVCIPGEYSINIRATAAPAIKKHYC